MRLIRNTILIIALTGIIWYIIDSINQDIWWGNDIDFDKWNGYGTLIGGVFSFLSILLIYLTLRHQTLSHENSAFENRFFQLIDYHKNNVAEFEYKNPASDKGEIINGQKVFINIHREILKAIKFLKKDLSINSLDLILNNTEILKIKKNSNIIERKIDVLQLEIVNIAYLIVFFGLSAEGRPVLERILTQRCESDKIATILNKFEEKQAKWDRLSNIGLNNQRLQLNAHNKYYGGHQHRLGHYFRHLFQTINYVDNFKPYKGNFEKKYSYLKNYRAQFSTYEQAIFAYNSISILGRVWELEKIKENDKLITKYNLIKNIPAEFITEFNIEIYYPNVDFEGKENTTTKKELIKDYK